MQESQYKEKSVILLFVKAWKILL